jgi:hypothetical protein
MNSSARSMKSDEFNTVLDRPHGGKSVSSAVCKIVPDLRNEQGSHKITNAHFAPVNNKLSGDGSTGELTRELSLVVILLSLVVFILFSLTPAV